MTTRLNYEAIDIHTHYRPSISGREFIEGMDRAGIERSVVLSCPDHPRYSLCGLTGTNEKVEELVKQHPDRLVGAVYIDPRSVMEAQTTARRYRDKGFPMVKAWPAHGFYPDDEKIYPVWETLEELKMGVLFHSGMLASGHNKKPAIKTEVVRSAAFNSKYGQPIYIDQPARFFPNLNFIIAHSGYPWTLEALAVSEMHRNVYIDFSCRWGFEGMNLIERVMPARVPWKRLLFGTDSSGGGSEREIVYWNDVATRPFFKEHAQDFFYNNANELLGKGAAKTE